MQKLSDIIGQERIKTFFRRIIASRKIPHALMLVGDEGSGKYSLARILAGNILCETVSAGNAESACGFCHACKQVEAGTHPDLIEVVHEKENTISVENIRTQINATAFVRPYQASRKIYIMDEARKMNPTAQNALLKTLEEPPHYVSIFLLTDNEEAMLDTIKSRCVRLRTAPVSKPEIKKYIKEHYDLQEELADIAVIYSGGIIGRAGEFANNPTVRERYLRDIDILGKLSWMYPDEMPALAREINQSHKDREEFFDLARKWYKDILIYKSGEAYGKMEFNSEESKIEMIADNLSFLRINQIFQSMDTAESRFRSNVNQDLTMQMFLTECLIR